MFKLNMNPGSLRNDDLVPFGIADVVWLGAWSTEET